MLALKFLDPAFDRELAVDCKSVFETGKLAGVIRRESVKLCTRNPSTRLPIRITGEMRCRR